MDQITTLLTTLGNELNIYQGLISDKKDELKLNPEQAVTLLKQLAIYEQDLSELKIFMDLVSKNKDFWMRLKEVNEKDLRDCYKSSYEMIGDAGIAAKLYLT